MQNGHVMASALESWTSNVAASPRLKLQMRGGTGCPPDCDKFAGKDKRCPCAQFPLHRNCPPNCKVYTGQDKRCPCEKNLSHENCPLDCSRFGQIDPRCKDEFCEANPRDPLCEGVELFGQPRFPVLTTTTTTVTTRRPPKPTTPRPRRSSTMSPRGGRNQKHDHGTGGHHDHHHGVDPRHHPFHSFHYDPGDGRRGRGRTRIGRSTDDQSSRKQKRSIKFQYDSPVTVQNSSKTVQRNARLAKHH